MPYPFRPMIAQQTWSTVQRFREAMLEDVDLATIDGLGTVVRAPESVYYQNTLVCVDELADEDAAREALNDYIERGRMNPDRALFVTRDRDVRLLAAVRRVASKFAVGTLPLGAYLDSHLRPELVCAQLKTGEDTRGKSVLTAAGAADLLNEKIFIDPNAYSEHQKAEIANVRAHLFDTWSKGYGPRFAVVIAPAGYGKSMLSHLLGKRLAEAYEASPPESKPPLPFLISFGNFRRGSTAFTGLIMNRLQADGPPLLNGEAFRELLDLGRVNFILDGFDEMIEANAETARQNIRDFIENAGRRARILLTSRSTFFRTRADVESEFQTLSLSEDEVEILELRPFTDTQIRQYINLRVPQGQGRLLDRAHKLVEERAIATAIKNPLFLREVIDLLNEGFSLPDTRRHGLLNHLVERALDRERERKGYDVSIDEQRRFLEGLGLELLRTELPILDGDVVELAAEIAIPALETSRTREADVTALLNHYYLIESGHGPNTFTMHQLWREYFQASALEKVIGDEEFYAIASRRELPGGVFEQLAERVSFAVVAKLAVPATLTGAFVQNWVRVALAVATTRKELDTLLARLPNGLRDRQLHYLTFAELDLRRLDVAGTQITSTMFEGCDLRGVDFTNSLLRSVVFRRCELDRSLLGAHVQAIEIDGVPYLHNQQLHSLFPATPEAQEGDGAGAVNEKLTLREILRSRLEIFVGHTAGGTPRARPSLKMSALTRGVDGQYSDLIRRGVYPALRRAGVLVDNREGHSDMIDIADGVAAEVIAFVVDDVAGPRIHAALERLERKA